MTGFFVGGGAEGTGHKSKDHGASPFELFIYYLQIAL